MPGSPLAVAVGRGGCGEIILGSAEWSRHQTHREEWITPTGRDSNKLQGGGDSGPDKSTGKEAGLQEGIRQGRRRSPVLR